MYSPYIFIELSLYLYLSIYPSKLISLRNLGALVCLLQHRIQLPFLCSMLLVFFFFLSEDETEREKTKSLSFTVKKYKLQP